MTYNEIVLFRRFMTNKGVLNTFEHFFEVYGLEKKTVDEYYDDASAEFVIMTAFDFSKCERTIFNYSCWEKIDQKWQHCLKRFREEGKMENPPELRCAKCGVMKPVSAFHLGKNLVPHKYCKECESGFVAKKAASCDSKTGIFKICSHCGKKKGLDEFYEKKDSIDGHANYCKDCMREAQRLRYNPKNENIQNMEDFTFYDFEQRSSVRERTLNDGQAAINYKKKGSYVTFNLTASNEIRNAGLNRVRVRIDHITGDMHLVFNKEHGAMVTLKNKKNVTVSNQQMVDFLMDRLHLDKKEGTRHVIKVGANLSNVDEFITYILIKGKK